MDAQINIGNEDGGDQKGPPKTVIELVFYYICTEDSKETVESYAIQNSEKYPLAMVSADIEFFMVIFLL